MPKIREWNFPPPRAGWTFSGPPQVPASGVDSGIESGAEIPPEFDSMVAKIIARGRDRDEAASRLKRALDECTIRIENGTTNRAFLRQLLDQPEVKAGGVSTAYVGELLKKGNPPRTGRNLPGGPCNRGDYHCIVALSGREG